MARLSRVQFLGWFYHKPFVIFKEVGAGVCDFLKPIYGLNKCGCIDYINKIFLKCVWKRSYFLIVLFNCVVLCLDAQLCPTLCDPMECSLPGSSVHGILQARTLEWVALPSSRWSSQPRDGTQVFYIAGRFFTFWATREAQEYCSG